MLNNVRSRVSATGSIVVAGTLSRNQQAETRGRRIGNNEITDSFRQIFGPAASLSDDVQLSEKHQCNDIAMDNFVKSNNFKHMIEDVAKLSGVQEVIFKHIPVTMFEKDKLITNSKDKLTIEKSASDEDENSSKDRSESPFNEMGWSMIGDEISPCQSVDQEETVTKQEFESLKEDKEDQVY